MIKDDEVAAVMKRAGVVGGGGGHGQVPVSTKEGTAAAREPKKAREMAEKTEKKAKASKAEPKPRRKGKSQEAIPSRRKMGCKLAEISRRSQGAFPTTKALATGKEEDAPVEPRRARKTKGRTPRFRRCGRPKRPQYREKSEEGGDFGGGKSSLAERQTRMRQS